MAKKQIKRYPIEYVLNENHGINKTTAKYHYTPIGTTKIQNADGRNLNKTEETLQDLEYFYADG